MKHALTIVQRLALGGGMALSAGLAGRELLADQAKDSEVTTTVIKRQVKTIEDSTSTTLGSRSGRSLTSSGGNMQSKRKYSDKSFSSSAYRQQAGDDLRRKREEAAKPESATNAPAVEAAGAAPAVDPALPAK